VIPPYQLASRDWKLISLKTMAQKTAEEVEEKTESNKLFTKQFNKFLSDYYNWIVGCTVILVLIAGFFSLLLPKYQQTVDYLSATNQQNVLDYSSKQAELNKVQQLIASYNAIDKKYIDKVNSIAPAVQNKEELFSQVNYLVSVNQLSLNSISLSISDGYANDNLLPITPAEQPISDGLQTVAIDISVSGTNYESFKNFLSSIENNLRLMDVQSVIFDPNGQTTNLIINTYYSKN
jgi:hypothetical protein